MKTISKLCAVIVLSSLSCVSFAKHTYNPTQLEQFEQTNKCSGCDLSNAVISKNHSGAQLDNANMSKQWQSGGINLSRANLRNANFTGSSLDGANFSGADLTGAHFDGAYVGYANFSNAKGVDLKNAREVCHVIMPDGWVTADC